MQNRVIIILEIFKTIPVTLPESSMIDFPDEYNQQEYTENNCRRFGIPFLKSFVDIDTCLRPEQNALRIQGYLKFKILEFAEYSVSELQYILKLVTKGEWRTKWEYLPGNYSKGSNIPVLEILSFNGKFD